TSYINWYDKASPGMLNDNIHVLNPGGTAATVTVSLPGAPSQTLNVAPGTEAYTTFPQGTIGGPVTVTSTQPVLASQRVQFQQSWPRIRCSSSRRSAKSGRRARARPRPPATSSGTTRLRRGCSTTTSTSSTPARPPPL